MDLHCDYESRRLASLYTSRVGNMKKSFACLVVVATIAILSFESSAQSSGWKSSSAKAARPEASSIVAISGSLSAPFTVDDTNPCTVGFSNKCPGLDCSCYTVTGTASFGKLGKGTATIYATLDFGSGFSSGDGDCFPAYLELDVATPKDTETWSGVGSACDSVDGRGSPITGGFGLQTSDLFSGAIVTFTMTPNFSKSTFKVKFSGKAEP